jgi:23S rRNA (uracil1939-C5)-methyltransferase
MTDNAQTFVTPLPSRPRPAHIPPSALYVESLDLEGQGVAHRDDGKVVFIEGALPGEWVSVRVLRKKNNWEQAEAVDRYVSSFMRVQPKCPHFGLQAGACGGCKLQHVDASAQVAIKQRALEDQLWHLGKVRPERMLRAIEGPAWGYRHRARLSVRYVAKKEDVLIGFHERKSRYVADMNSCAILPPTFSELMLPLRHLIMHMDARETCPQIELAMGDRVMALVLRHLEPLSDADLQRLRDFAQRHTHEQRVIEWWLQPKGPDTVKRIDGQPSDLAYRLDTFGMRMPYKPTDFTQVNPHINEVLVEHALAHLQPQSHERVIDWFCGLGNFTWPLATRAAQVLGIEGSATLVARAQANQIPLSAQRSQQQLPAMAPVQFVERNLFDMTPEQLRADGYADKWLVDPPREGAFALVKALAEAVQNPEPNHPWQPPQRVVYVSCNPATLARDAGILVHLAGYRCVAAGAINMFAHTAHVESMAVFERG